jgi:hypothetical protein
VAIYEWLGCRALRALYAITDRISPASERRPTCQSFRTIGAGRNCGQQNRCSARSLREARCRSLSTEPSMKDEEIPLQKKGGCEAPAVELSGSHD